jgi:nucleoside-diphosphate-sugar epimerase
VFGPRQDPLSQYAAVVPRFITALMDGRPPSVFGDGEQTRDFTYVGNAVEGTVLAMSAEGAAGKVFNVAAGSRTSLNELLRTLQRLSGRGVEPSYEDARPGEVRHSQADVSAAERELGFRPRYSVEEGLQETVDWYSR